MTANDDESRAEHERALLLQLIHESGLDADPAMPPPDAEAFVAAMKASDHRRRFRRRAIALGAAAAASIAVIGGVVLDPWSTQRAVAVTPPLLSYEYANARDIARANGTDPAAALRRAARTAEATLPHDDAADRDASQVVTRDAWYAEIDEQSAAVVPRVIESTLNPDGSQRIVDRRGTPLAADGRGISTNDTSTGNSLADETLEPGTRDPNLLDRLRVSPEAARTTLLDRAGCTSTGHDTTASWCLYTEIADLWTNYVVDNEVGANLWIMLSREVGFTNLGTVRDRADRPGIGIAITPPHADQFRNVLIISTDTGALLGTEDILVRADAGTNLTAPAIFAFTAITDSRWADPRHSRSEN